MHYYDVIHRLDMDIEGQKLRDTFTWNKNGM